MTIAQSKDGPGQAQDRFSERSPLWKWGAAGAAAAGLGIAAFNGIRARRAKQNSPPLGSFVEVDGVRLHYLETGAGRSSSFFTATTP